MASSEPMPNMDRKASIENLPVEITLEILKRLPEVSSLINLMKASPSAFRAIHGSKFSQNIVLESILSKEIEGHLPLATKRLDALEKFERPSRLFDPNPAPDYESAIRQFSSEQIHRRTGKHLVDLNWFTLEKAVEMASFHAVVSQWVGIMTKTMTIPIGQSNSQGDHCFGPLVMDYLDDQERYRVANMLYATELVSILFPIKYPGWNEWYQDTKRYWRIFWAGFKPWEYCQFIELQMALTDFFKNKFWEHYFSLDTPIGVGLRKIYTGCTEPAQNLHRACQGLAIHSGLRTLLTAVPSARPNSGKKAYQPTILDHIESIDWRAIFCALYIDTGFPTNLAIVYEEWLGYGYRTEQNLLDEEDPVYFVKFADNPEDPAGIDDAPLRCWLFDLLKYDLHHDTGNEVIGWLRSTKRVYIMTSFLSEYRWQAKGWQLPSLADLRQQAEQYFLYTSGPPVRKSDSPGMYYKAPDRYEIGNYPKWIDR